jgi:hypothetical protein
MRKHGGNVLFRFTDDFGPKLSTLNKNLMLNKPFMRFSITLTWTKIKLTPASDAKAEQSIVLPVPGGP